MKRKSGGWRRDLPAAAAALLLCQCNLLGTAGSLLITEEDEMQLGAAFDRHLRDSARAENPVFVANTPVRQAYRDYVVNLANEILNAIPAGEKPGYAANPGFTITLIDRNVQNAFAVPGGYVYIYTGIIDSMRDESELAGVLGHEIAHVTRHHYRDALAQQAGLSLLLQALIGDDAGKILQLVAAGFASLAALAITRENEEEADVYGTRYEGAVRRNPMGIANFFARMQSQGLSILSTHPLPGDRVGDVTAQVNGDPALSALNVDSLKFQARFQYYTGPVGP